MHSLFRDGQQDAIEFIRIFLSDISNETNISNTTYKEFLYEDLSKKELSKKYNEHYLSRENSIVTDIYYTQIINIFTCTCGRQSYSFQKLLDIPLLIPEKMREVNLDILIENFLSEIVVDLNDNCLYCKKKREKIKKIMKFDILKQIIIFSIQRIDPFASIKNNTFIKYDEIISLKKFKDKSSFRR